MRRSLAVLAVLALVSAALLTESVAAKGGASGNFPAVIALPIGFQPEGIATGEGRTFYVGSIPSGAVRKGDYLTGTTEPLVPAQAGRAAIGLEEAGGRLFVSGGPTGKAFVYDAATGADVAVLTLTTLSPTFINDVVVTEEAAYFTDSRNQQFYRVERATLAVTTVPITGDLVYTTGFNANGIDATPDGQTLVIVQTNQGKLFTADPETGVTDLIELPSGQSVVNGDGILLHGRNLYVVQNQLNQVTTVHLSPDLTAGDVVGVTTSPDFRVPTTIAKFGERLYAVNARFGVQNPQSADFSVVGFRRP